MPQRAQESSDSAGQDNTNSPAQITRAVRENPEWTIVFFFGAFWLTAIILGPFYDSEHWLLTVGLALGASATGALPGFLFGLPRVPPTPASATTGAETLPSNGTSLEQIADWLTKIVVGAGLVEMKSLIPWYGELCSRIGSEYGRSPSASAFVGAWLAYFAVAGFFAAYNLTRVYLSPVYRDLEHIVRERLAPIVEDRARTEERMRDLAAEGLRRLNPSATFTTMGEPSSAVTIRPGSDPKDPCKGQFGGVSAVNGYRLLARFFPVDRPTSKTGTVELLVENTDVTREFEGAVVFYLHPTFEVPIVRVPIESGRASMRITLWGGSTVGAVTPDGTKLELDLSDEPGAPEFVREL